MRSPLSLGLSTLVASSALLAGVVNAHGQIHSVSADGQTIEGPNIYYAEDAKNSKTAVRTMYSAQSPAYVRSSDFRDPSKMSCEGSGSTGAPAVLTVAAGSTVEVAWEGATPELDGIGGLSAYHPWVHAMGPIIDYITSCNGDCSDFDAAEAGWTKLQEFGFDPSQTISDELRGRMASKPEPYQPASGSGLWGMAKLIQDGSKWYINVPKELADGQYLLRNEITAVHAPDTGPQLYVGCIQIEVTGGGGVSLPAGTKAYELYDPSGDFANFNVYSSGSSSFQVPGPAVWSPSSGSSENGSASSSSSAETAPSSSSAAAEPTSSSSAPTPTTSSAPSSTGAAPSEAAETPAGTTAAASSASSAASTKPTACRARDGRKRRRSVANHRRSHQRRRLHRLSSHH